MSSNDSSNLPSVYIADLSRETMQSLGKRIRVEEAEQPRKRFFRCMHQNHIIEQLELLEVEHSQDVHKDLYECTIDYLWKVRCAFHGTDDPPRCQAHDAIREVMWRLHDSEHCRYIPEFIEQLHRYFVKINQVLRAKRLQREAEADEEDEEDDQNETGSESDVEDNN